MAHSCLASTKQWTKMILSCRWAIVLSSQTQKLKAPHRWAVRSKCHFCLKWLLENEARCLYELTDMAVTGFVVGVASTVVFRASRNFFGNQMHTYIERMSTEAYGDDAAWLQPQLQEGLPVYSPLLINHVKPVKLDWESLSKRVI